MEVGPTKWPSSYAEPQVHTTAAREDVGDGDQFELPPALPPMDAKRAATRRPHPQPPAAPPAGCFSDPELSQTAGGCCMLFSECDNGTPCHPPPEKRRAVHGRRKVLTLACLMASCLTVFPALALLAGIHRQASPQDQRIPLLLRQLHRMDGIPVDHAGYEARGSPASSERLGDKLLGGLLADGFDAGSCLSRYQSAIYRRSSGQRKPSAHLQKKLRAYEALHRKCGPGTELYREASRRLRSNRSISPSSSTECRYLVWISFSGLGNRILTLASSFLYALLTDRVLLVDRGEDMASLFCEPFLGETWLLPLDFPLLPLHQFQTNSSSSFGNLLRNKVGDAAGRFIYLHLAHDYSHHDKLFFCERNQIHLRNVPWLLLRSDNYFIPSMFLIPAFQQELNQIFPEKELVFHHLGRYLFHPANSVWGLIIRFYGAYLAGAEEMIGIQIRVFDTGTGPFEHVMEQVLACVLDQKLLPKVKIAGEEGEEEEEEELQRRRKTTTRKKKKKKKVVLVTSLNSGYFERIRSMYWESPTEDGEVVSVHQPSHEEHQRSGDLMHGMKAWAEMYMLSLTDVLVTSAWSTFGYVAQGLGGVRPWILTKAENRTAPDPPCRPAVSAEPCFHAPPFYDCVADAGVDTGTLLPHVTHCEDVSWGLKLVDRAE